MDILLEAFLALLLLTTAIYAHKQLPFFTAGKGRIVLLRTILVLTGIGFGLMAKSYVMEPMHQIMAFAIGFGMVHLPAAVILLIKAKRGEGKS
jgi:hypothetical protein